MEEINRLNEVKPLSDTTLDQTRVHTGRDRT